MKYFLDTEFIEKPNTIELISIGIVAEDGREYYAVHTEADLKNANDWVIKNLLEKMPQYNKSYHDLRAGGGSPDKYGKKTIKDINKEVFHFCGQQNNVPEECEFYGYYADYDWVIFCWIFGKMIDLPKGFPMYCRDLKQMLDDTVDNYIYSKRMKYGIAMLVDGKQLTLKEKIQKIKEHPDFPKQKNEHNALADARWNYELYKFLSQ